MKTFRLLFATLCIALMTVSCADSNVARDDKRAAKVVAEIRNPKSKNGFSNFY